MPGEGGWPAGAALLRNACGQGGPVGARGLLLSYRHNGHSRHQATGRSPFSVGGCGRMGPWRPHPPSLLPSTPRMQDALVAPPVRTRRCLLLTPAPPPRPLRCPPRPRPSPEHPARGRPQRAPAALATLPSLSATSSCLGLLRASFLAGPPSPRAWLSMGLGRRGDWAEPRSSGACPWAPALGLSLPPGAQPGRLALPGALHPTGPVQPGLFFWGKMRGFALCTPRPQFPPPSRGC